MLESSEMAISCLPSSVLMRIEYGWLTKHVFPFFHPTSYSSLIWEFPFLFTHHPCYLFDDLPCQCVSSTIVVTTLFLWHLPLTIIMITKKASPCPLPPSPPIASSLVFEVAYSHFLPSSNMYLASTIVTILFFWHIFSTIIPNPIPIPIPITVQQSLLWPPGIHSHVCLSPPTGSSLTSTCFCHLRLFAPISQCASCHCCTGLWLVFFIYHSIVTFPVPLLMIYLEMCIVPSGSHDII